MSNAVQATITACVRKGLPRAITDVSTDACFRLFAPSPDDAQRLAFGGQFYRSGSFTPDEAFFSFRAPTTGTYFIRMTPARTFSTVGNYRILTAYGDPGTYRARDQRDIFVTHSDGGVHFSTPARVNDNAIGFDDFLPEVVVAADGCPYVTWYDHRDDLYGTLRFCPCCS